VSTQYKVSLRDDVSLRPMTIILTQAREEREVGSGWILE